MVRKKSKSQKEFGNIYIILETICTNLIEEDVCSDEPLGTSVSDQNLTTVSSVSSPLMHSPALFHFPAHFLSRLHC